MERWVREWFWVFRFVGEGGVCVRFGLGSSRGGFTVVRFFSCLGIRVEGSLDGKVF